MLSWIWLSSAKPALVRCPLSERLLCVARLRLKRKDAKTQGGKEERRLTSSFAPLRLGVFALNRVVMDLAFLRKASAGPMPAKQTPVFRWQAPVETQRRRDARRQRREATYFRLCAFAARRLCVKSCCHGSGFPPQSRRWSDAR